MAGEFGIVYKGCLADQYTDEVVAIKTLKGMVLIIRSPNHNNIMVLIGISHQSVLGILQICQLLPIALARTRDWQLVLYVCMYIHVYVMLLECN